MISAAISMFKEDIFRFWLKIPCSMGLIYDSGTYRYAILSPGHRGLDSPLT